MEVGPVVVSPTPEGEEELRYVTLEIGSIAPAVVMNKLAQAGLFGLDLADRRRMKVNHNPELSVVEFMDGSITFEDVNIHSRRSLKG